METKDKIDIKSLSLDELTGQLVCSGEKKFRAGQIYQWIHQKRITSFAEMTNLPGKLKEGLAQRYRLTVLKEVTMQESAADGTRKYLFELEDGNRIESVLMKYQHGNSVCISSQVGCRMGCSFCASAIGGLIRNLTPSEMLDQIYRMQDSLGERVSNVVVMGTGEPLDNYDNLLKFIELLSDENGLNISQRNITVSTCGIVPAIRKLADAKLQITLALSLHASTQKKRQELMPVAKAYQLDEVLDACRYYFKQTGRRMTFEYSLIAGMNDSAEDAAELAALLNGLNCHVNLIPVNPVRENDYAQPNARAVQDFKNKLEKYKINVTIRREMGRDIDGACGQLRQRFAER